MHLLAALAYVPSYFLSVTKTEKLRKMEKQIYDFIVKCEKRRIFATERAT